MALHGWISPNGIMEQLEKDIQAGNNALQAMPYDLLTDKDGLNLREYQVKAIKAFSYLNLAQASIFTNLVTVVSIAAGIVFLGESFTALQGIGSMAILTGVYLSNHIKGRTE